MFRSNTLAAILLFCVVSPAMSQESQPLVLTATVEVNRQMVDEFRLLEKELSEAQKKAGLPWRNVWMVVVGPRMQYLEVAPLDSLAYFDGDTLPTKVWSPEELEAWRRRMRKCIVRRRVEVGRRLPEVAIPLTEGRKAKLTLVHYIHVVPGKGGQLTDLLEKELIPAYRKAGENGVWLGRRSLGVNSREFLFGREFETWAEMDGKTWIFAPVVAALGQEKAQELIARMAPLMAFREEHVLALQEDLSFTPE
jgi:hypothetical protein